MADIDRSVQRQLSTEQQRYLASLDEKERSAVLRRSTAQWYQVWRPALDRVAHDPLDPEKRYHEGLFVETRPEESLGTLFHVTGDVLAASGMRYEERTEYAPTKEKDLHSITLVGYIRPADFDDGTVARTLRALPRPTRQQGINFWEPDPVTGRHPIIWCREDGERYVLGEERRPVIKCNEWTDTAVKTLLETGVLHSQLPDADGERQQHGRQA